MRIKKAASFNKLNRKLSDLMALGDYNFKLFSLNAKCSQRRKDAKLKN